MKVRVLEEQSDLFEIGVLSQTAEIEAIALKDLFAAPAGSPVVFVGNILNSERLQDFRQFATAVGRAKVAVVVVPPFNDLDIGRYFDTPVQLRALRHSTEATARVIEGSAIEVLGEEIKIRSDHHFDTALGAGVVAVDQQGKPVLIRFQATNTSGPVFFSTLQLLTYTALTDEGQRQATLTHLLSWGPPATTETLAEPSPATREEKPESVGKDILIPVALLLSAGGLQATELISSRARALLGVDLSHVQVCRTFEEFEKQGILESEPDGWRIVPDRLDGFVERLGLHAYARELTDLIATEEKPA